MTNANLRRVEPGIGQSRLAPEVPLWHTRTRRRQEILSARYVAGAPLSLAGHLGIDG